MNKWNFYQDFEIFFTSESNLICQFSNKNILLTGVTGLIGSAVLDFFIFLKKKKDITINIFVIVRDIDKLKINFSDNVEDGTITPLIQNIESPVPDKYSFDYIIHGASVANPRFYVEKPVDTIYTTLKGIENILETAKRTNANVVHLSSVEVYGETEGVSEKIRENEFGFLDSNTLRASYAEAKRLSETLCHAYFSQYKVKAVIGRLCKTYGPSSADTDERVMAYLFDVVKRQEDIKLQSDGSRIFSFCYVTDAVSALITLLLKGQPGQAYNISDDASIASLKEIASYVAKISGVNLYLNKNTTGLGVSKDAIVDSSELQKLGWVPKINIYSGLDRQYALIK